jgi:hypothetical protein
LPTVIKRENEIMAKSKLMVLVAFVLLMALPTGVVLAQDVTGIGTATISDDAFFSDAVTYEMTGVTIPEEETAYEGWLVSDDGATLLSTGVMVVDDNGNVNHTFTSSSGENLIRNYSQVRISIEPVPDTDTAPSGTYAFQSQIGATDLLQTRALVADSPADSGKGTATKLVDQLEAAHLEASSIASRSTTATISEINDSIERVVNAIEGPNGSNYADHDADGTIESVGDGIGAIPHANDVITTASTAESAHGATAQGNAQSSIDFMNLAVSKAAADVIGGTESGARLNVGQVAGLVDNALNGLDADLDGTISGSGEAGARQAYREAQLIGTSVLVGGAVTTTTPDPVVVTPALPTTGDNTIPMLAQAGMAVAVILILSGGLLMARERRSRKIV